MAEGDDSDKTEEPTQRKLDDAAEQGDVVKSHEVSLFFTLGAVTLIVSMAAGPSTHALVGPLRGLIEHSGEIAFDNGALRHLMAQIGIAIGTAIAAPLLMMLVAGVVGNMIQHRLVFSAESLKPKFSKVSPLAGLKRLFSVESLINFGKGTAKIIVVTVAMFLALWPERERADAMINIDLASVLGISQSLSVSLLGTVLSVMFLIAVFDYGVTYFRFMRRHRMSLQEIKDEHKQAEGDPTVKGKLKQLRAERSRQRMMSAVPKATVVVTNPTHYAVALLYEEGMQAPKCVAKGTDEVALRIREIAKGANVAVVENPPLARALYAAVEIDQEIPEQHYKAVAEVVGYVINLKKKRSWR